MKLKSTTTHNLNAEELKVAIILPYFNEKLGLTLFQNCKKTLLKSSVKENHIKLIRVAGALEIPLIAKTLIQTKEYDVIIAMGIVIRGETTHYDQVCDNTHQALMNLQLSENFPIIFAIMTCENIEQVIERVEEKKLNKGKEAAEAAIIQYQTIKQIKKG